MTQSPQTERVALHACCGPCLIVPVDDVAAEGLQPAVVYYNPNIHPAEEYERRRDVAAAYAAAEGIEFVELEYDPESWQQAVRDASSREQRCRACYRLRLGTVARWAAANGLATVATTLTISPYQDARAIAEQGSASAREAGVRYLDRDFRDRYPEATRRSREAGMYRQNYCGCAPSRQEAEQQREQRRAERAAAREDRE